MLYGSATPLEICRHAHAAENQLGRLAINNEQTLNRKAKPEPVPRAIAGEPAEVIHNFPADGAVAMNEILGVFLTGSELLWVEKLTAIALRKSTTTVGSNSTSMHKRTCSLAPVSEWDVLNASSPPIISSLGF